jgi:Phage integrase family/Phage integrase, N-terminal SAM-like domain
MTGRQHFGSIRRLPSGRYQASYWHQGRRHIAQSTFVTKSDANAFLAEVATTIHRGNWVDPDAGRISFARYATRWLEQRTDLRASTRDQYGWLIADRLIPYFGRQDLARITPSDVRDWPAQGGTPMRPKTLASAWFSARKSVGLPHVRFHDLRHFAGTMAAASGASTRELMARGGWSTVAMVTHYQHATEDRDAFLARAMAPFVAPSTPQPESAATSGAAEIEIPSRTNRARQDPHRRRRRSAPLPTRDSGEKSSGGETRTLNLAVNSRLLCH